MNKRQLISERSVVRLPIKTEQNKKNTHTHTHTHIHTHTHTRRVVKDILVVLKLKKGV